MESKKEVNKNNKAFLTKKEKANIRQTVLDEINDEVRTNLCNTVMDDINERLNDEYKENLKETISNELISDIKENIKADEKRMNRRKNFKIVRLYIYILLLIGASVFLIYKLYITGNLDLTKDIKVEPKTTQTTEKVKDLKYYMNEYGNILDNIKFDNVELFKGNYDISKIDVKDRLAIAYNNLSNDAITKDGMIYTIKAEDLSNSYLEVFGTLDGYKETEFNIGSSSFVYQTTTNNYISISANDIVKNNILTEITNITEEDDELFVTAIVAYVKDNKIYNINNLETSVKDYIQGESLKDSESVLTKTTFKFKKIENKYFINSILNN